MRRRDVPIGALVHVVVDDMVAIDGAWKDGDDVAEQPPPVEAAGWVVNRGPRFLTLAALRAPAEYQRTCGQLVHLPWGAVVSVKVLRK